MTYAKIKLLLRFGAYSTVTDLAGLRGWSTSHPGEQRCDGPAIAEDNFNIGEKFGAIRFRHTDPKLRAS